MSLDISNSNVNRNITLAGTSVAIFTFLLFFLYPRYRSGDVDPILFQFTIVVIVSVIFSLVISGLYYYSDILTMSVSRDKPARIFGRAELSWFVGYSLLLLEPSLILFTINLPVVGGYALILWFAYSYATWLEYKRQTRKK